MKMLLLLLTLTGIVSACQSEYRQQMVKAQELVREEIKIRQAMKDQFSGRSVVALSEFEEEIQFHAHLSGNETVFLRELGHFKNQLVQKEVANPTLISKYP